LSKEDEKEHSQHTKADRFIFLPGTSVIRDILPGREILLHAEKKIIPINTAIQFVKIIAMRYPAIAQRLKKSHPVSLLSVSE
jgi:hypothetical protein